MYKTTKIQQTKQHHEVDLSILKAMCFHSARLYNVGLYSIRQHDYFNRICHFLVNKCLAYGVSTLVIGYNKGQKQDINLGKVNNQKIVAIPYHKFRRKLESICSEYGINYISQEESYTSKANALNCDIIPTYGEHIDKVIFSGKRIHRGLYCSSEGLCLNADINGSINILRKYFKERHENWIFQDSIRAFVNMPCQRVKPFAQAPSLKVV